MQFSKEGYRQRVDDLRRMVESTRKVSMQNVFDMENQSLKDEMMIIHRKEDTMLLLLNNILEVIDKKE